MVLEINRLKIRNFKGLAYQDIHFGDVKTEIYGASGTGKSTIIDAYNWLILGKDREGKKEQNIKRISTDNYSKKSDIDYSVEGEFLIDNKRVILTKTLVERYDKNDKLIGHKIINKINGVEYTSKEYIKILKNYFSDELFLILTNSLFFCSLSNEKQIRCLLNIFHTEKHKSLNQRMKNLSAYEYRKEIINQRREVNELIELINERIKERTYIQNIYSDIPQPELVIGAMTESEQYDNWFSKIASHIGEYIHYITTKTISVISSERLYDLVQANNELTSVLTKLNKELTLVNGYISESLKEIEEEINSRLDIARVEIISNEHEECLVIKADEIEYNSLSRERKKEVDLDIILAISGYTNVNIPIFIDNAEGLKNTADIEKQTIVLTRSDEDKLYVR